MVENLSIEVIVLKAVVASSGHQLTTQPSQDTQMTEMSNGAVSATQEITSAKDIGGPDDGDGKFFVV